MQNKGFIRQNGNILFTKLPETEKVIAIHQFKYKKVYKLIAITQSGKIYIHNPQNQSTKLLDKTVSGSSIPNFTDFLNGVIVSSKTDSPF